MSNSAHLVLCIGAGGRRVGAAAVGGEPTRVRGAAAGGAAAVAGCKTGGVRSGRVRFGGTVLPPLDDLAAGQERERAVGRPRRAAEE
eukprot:6433669-Prymnesium_polylepis.1